MRKCTPVEAIWARARDWEDGFQGSRISTYSGGHKDMKGLMKRGGGKRRDA